MTTATARWEGSYNGKPFHLDKSLYKSGRRSFIFEYPHRDDPDGEDLGRKSRRFQLDFFVIGRKYITARDELLAELNKPGPGNLIHPWYGSLRVMVGDITVTETVDALGNAGFSAEFTVVAGVAANAPIRVPIVAVNLSAQLLDTAALVTFTERWSVKGPIALLGLAEAGITAAMNTVQAIQGRFDAINQATNLLRLMGQQVTSLVLTPANLGLQLVSALHTITETQFNPLSALKTELQILREVARPRSSHDGATAVQRQADANDGALSVLIRAAVFADACRLVSGSVDRAMSTDIATPAPGVTFETRAQALTARDQLLQQADTLLLDAPDGILVELMDLVSTLVQAVDQLALTGTLETVVLPGTLPAVLVAYRLTGDAATVEDLITRNNLRHPLFTPAGEPIEVLNG